MEKPARCPAAAPSATTFVQADAATFKDLVQRLTGLQEPPRLRTTWPLPPPHAQPPSPLSSSSSTKLSGLKRLHNLRRSGPPLTLAIPTTASAPAKMNATALASPSTGFAELDINSDDDDDDELNEEEEERAIKERRFYLHPSPRSRARAAEPALLPLFPMTPAKASEPREM